MYFKYSLVLICSTLARQIAATTDSLQSKINGTNQTSAVTALPPATNQTLIVVNSHQSMLNGTNQTSAATTLPPATNQTLIVINSTTVVQRGVLFAFGCDSAPLFRCRPKFDSYVQNVLGAITCLKQHVPDIPISFAIPDPSFLEKSKLSHIPHVYVDRRLMKTAHISKAFAAESSPYNYTLVLDADTCVMSSDIITSFFEPLRFYDFVSVWECCALVDYKGLAFPSTGGGWEPQTGAFSFRASSKELMLLWANEYIKRSKMYYRFSSRDQQALAYIFDMNPSFRFFVLPARYNWRPYTSDFSPSFNTTEPAILHDHRLHGKKIKAESRISHADSLKTVVLCETIKNECTKINQGSMCK
jgi:hypothetical protein